MEWFKKSAGLKIFIAIWLLVLLVPLWRLRATRQLKSDDLTFVNFHLPDSFLADKNMGLQPNEQASLAQQFPNDVASQLIGMGRFKRSKSVSDAAQFTITNREYFTHYVRLSRQFPNDLSIRKQWLSEAALGELKVESAAQMASYDIPRMPQNDFWLSEGERKAALRCANIGAKREPDNAFWPWMQAIFNFSFRQDTEAIIALQRAAKCTRFDDGVDEATRRNIELMHRFKRSDWEDDFAEMTAIWMPHLAKFRSVARATMWQAKLALDKGDTDRALQLSNILQNATVPLVSYRGSATTRLVGEAIASISWYLTLRNASLPLPKYPAGGDVKARNAHRQAVAAAYAKYATENGHADYGKSALELQSKFRGITFGELFRDPNFNGLPQKIRVIKQYHWLLSKLLYISICCALLWGITWLMSRKASVEKTVIARAMTIWAAFSIGVTATVLMVGTMLISDGTFTNDDYMSQPTTRQMESRDSLNLGLLLILTFVVLAPVLIASFPRINWKPQFKSARGVEWLNVLKFIIFICLFVGIGTTALTITNPDLNSRLGQLWPAPIFATLLFGFCTLMFYVMTTQGKMRIGIMMVSAGIVVSILCFISGDMESQFFSSSITLLAIFFLFAGAFLIRSERNVTVSGIKAFLLQVVLRTRTMAAAIALACSVFYLLVTLAVMPVRRDLKNSTDRQLKIGEVAYLEEKLAGR